jgi:hypothetical protein
LECAALTGYLNAARCFSLSLYGGFLNSAI